LHYSIRAAEKALSKYSLPESLRYFRIAEEALDNNYRAYPRLYTRILLGIADIHLHLGDPLSAIEALSPLLNERYFKIDLGVQAVCLRMRAEARRQLGEVQSAISDYETALSILEQWREPQLHLPSSLLISREKEHLAAQLGRAESLFDLRQNELAAEIIQQELSHLDRSKYTNETAQALNLLAGIAYRENEIQKATEWMEQCLAIYLSNGNRLGAGSAYINLGLLAEARQDVSTATDYFKLGWDIHQAMGNSEGMATAKNNLGQLELKRGRFKEAVDHLLHAANIARRSELTQLLAQTLSNLGHAHHLLGNISLAMKKLEEARTVCLSYSLNDTLCEVLWKRAECSLSQGNIDAAAESADQSLNLAQRLDSHDLECEALRVLSRIARMKNDPSSAFAHARAAWEGTSDHTDPVTRSRFAVELALALIANNYRDEAVQLLRNHVLKQPIIAPPQIQEELRHYFQALKTD
jgi:tetratricopeptide (TPR) repeat protein